MVRSYQVGEGGMMVDCWEPLPEGTLVLVNFFLTATLIVIVRGVVRSTLKANKTQPDRYGIEFVNLGFHFKREIRNFVASATHLDGNMTF